MHCSLQAVRTEHSLPPTGQPYFQHPLHPAEADIDEADNRLDCCSGCCSRPADDCCYNRLDCYSGYYSRPADGYYKVWAGKDGHSYCIRGARFRENGSRPADRDPLYC